MLLSTVSVVLAAVSAIQAHFLLNYPVSQGFDEDKEPLFCGGFPQSANRSQFPLGNGLIWITSEHPQFDVLVTISITQNPANFSSFNSTLFPQTAATVLPFAQFNGEGDHCFATNIGSLGIPAAVNGANATIQVEFNGGDGNLFQCADVVLSSTATPPSPSTCATIVPAPAASSTSPAGADTIGTGTAPSGTLGFQLSAFSAAMVAILSASLGFALVL